MNSKLILLGLAVVLLSSCSIQSRNMRTPNYLVNFDKQDFEFSEQVKGSARVTRVLGIDWKRLFKWNTATNTSDLYFQSQNAGSSVSLAVNGFAGSISNLLSGVPVVGYLPKGQAINYAMYDVLSKNPGYDIMIYPQYVMTKKGVPFFFMVTEVEIITRLGKVEP